MNVGGSLHVGQQIGVVSWVGRQIGVVWVVSIGDGCARNRSMRSDTGSVRYGLALLAVVSIDQGTRKPWLTARGLDICICSGRRRA